jgi:hypothetical protein
VDCNHLVFWPTHWEIRSCRLGLSSWFRVSHSDLLRAGPSADRTPGGGGGGGGDFQQPNRLATGPTPPLIPWVSFISRG